MSLKSTLRFAPALSFFTLLLTATAFADPFVIYSAAGPDAAAIQGTVDQFRADLGTLNQNNPGSVGSGRREINWDGVPDAFSAPNNMPGNFFNGNVSGRARGAVFSTPGTGFQNSANVVNPSSTAIEFGNINPTYPSLFATFSSQRLFTAVGSNVLDVTFFIPGTDTPAVVSGFGSVFTDVDLANVTSISYFDASNNLLGTYFVPAVAGNETLSFLGVLSGSPVISRVRITSGNQALGPNEIGTSDIVVMDDFIYGEPVQPAAAAVPEPATMLLFGTGLAGFGAARRKRRKD